MRVLVTTHGIRPFQSKRSTGYCRKQKRSKIYSAFILCARLCIAKQNLSIGVNVVSRGSPSRSLRVRLVSLGITMGHRTIPVAGIFFPCPWDTKSATGFPVALFV
jgi:hypothetical protein